MQTVFAIFYTMNKNSKINITLHDKGTVMLRLCPFTVYNVLDTTLFTINKPMYRNPFILNKCIHETWSVKEREIKVVTTEVRFSVVFFPSI